MCGTADCGSNDFCQHCLGLRAPQCDSLPTHFFPGNLCAPYTATRVVPTFLRSPQYRNTLPYGTPPCPPFSLSFFFLNEHLRRFPGSANTPLTASPSFPNSFPGKSPGKTFPFLPSLPYLYESRRVGKNRFLPEPRRRWQPPRCGTTVAPLRSAHFFFFL